MQKEYLIELGDVVVAVKQPDGNVKLKQLFQPVPSGAALGRALGRAQRHVVPPAAGRRSVGAASGAYQPACLGSS
jgi:uncharacterized membrane protein